MKNNNKKKHRRLITPLKGRVIFTKNDHIDAQASVLPLNLLYFRDVVDSIVLVDRSLSYSAEMTLNLIQTFFLVGCFESGGFLSDESRSPQEQIFIFLTLYMLGYTFIHFLVENFIYSPRSMLSDVPDFGQYPLAALSF